MEENLNSMNPHLETISIEESCLYQNKVEMIEYEDGSWIKYISNEDETLMICETSDGECCIEISDLKNNQLYVEHMNREWSRFTRDNAGRIVKVEDNSGVWVKLTYDEAGRELTYENSSGIWRKREYDDRGNETYLEMHDGFWCERRYDDEGNEYYYKDSDGL